MAVTREPVFVQLPKITPVSFVNADGTAKKTLVTAGTDGTKVLDGTITSTDTAARNVQLWLTRSAVSYLIGTVAVAIAAGSDGTTNGVRLLDTTLIPGLPLDHDGHKFILLQSGDTLQVNMLVAVTATKEVDVVAMSIDF